MSLDLLALINEPPDGRDTATDSDGWVFDVATGEVVGRLDADGFLVRDRFEVTDNESADWVMRVRSDVEAEVAKLDLQFAAIRKLYEARRNAQYRRLAWWEFRFATSLIAFARSQLTGKVRTWRGAFGSIAFRKTQGTTKVLDDEAALAFVKTYTPELVKVVESINLKAIMAAKAKAEEVIGEAVELNFVKESQPGENVQISTGIEIKGEKA